MRNQNNAFHLAVPCRDLQEAVDFYENKLGCENRRTYDDRVTFNFFGDQLDGITDSIDYIPDVGTYGGRQPGGIMAPSILIDGFNLTL